MVLVGKIRWIEKDIFNTLREMAQRLMKPIYSVKNQPYYEHEGKLTL